MGILESKALALEVFPDGHYLEMPSSTLYVEHKIFFGANYSKAVGGAFALPTLRDNAIKGRHASLPLQITTYSEAVGANLRVRPGLT
jgi:hypothetical protein